MGDVISPKVPGHRFRTHEKVQKTGPWTLGNLEIFWSEEWSQMPCCVLYSYFT